MNCTRRTLLHAVAGAGMLPATRAFAQSDWPARPVRLVSPYAPGGASDLSARLIAEALRRVFDQPVLVENKPGAATRIANEHVARAAPDGQTFLYAAAPYATVEALFGKLAYDPLKDLRPVAMAVMAPVFLIVNAASSMHSVRDLIAYGRSRPDGLTFGSPAAGSQPHLAAELLLREAGVKGLNVHLRGDAMAYTELLAGRVDATFTAITSALPHIEAGKLRVLGVAATERSPIHPSAPTVAEQGFPAVVASGWYGFLAPAGTADAIVGRMESAVRQVLSDRALSERLLAQGLEARPGSAADFGRFIEAESRKWGDLIRQAGLKAE